MSFVFQQTIEFIAIFILNHLHFRIPPHWKNVAFLPPLLLSIIAITMSEAAVTVRVRKFMRNPLLKRRQMVVCK